MTGCYITLFSLKITRITKAHCDSFKITGNQQESLIHLKHLKSLVITKIHCDSLKIWQMFNQLVFCTVYYSYFHHIINSEFVIFQHHTSFM